MKFHLILAAGILFFCSFLAPVERLSMNMTARTLKDGKSITAKGEVYYQVAGGKMVTRFTSPTEYLVITNTQGELSIYSPSENTLTQSTGADYSSENSFIYYFLHGKTQDMGLAQSGFTIKETKFEEKMVITTWTPPANLSHEMSKAELVQENYLPIYMGFYDPKGKPLQKVYYSQYQKAGYSSVPTRITEIQFFPKGDSLITRRVYDELKTNEQVDKRWLEFKIPANAKIIK